MPHDHHHGHHHAAAGDRSLGLAVAVNLGLTAAQIVGGIVSGSVALIADAVHNLSDALALVLAFAARRIARRPPDLSMTFGYRRAETVAALMSYTALVVVALYLAGEAVVRLSDPPAVEGWIVIAVACIALGVDTATALLTWRLSRESANVRAAFLHNLADALGSVAVIVAGTLILLFDWRLIDPLATLAIAGWILWTALREMRPVIRLLMDAAPVAPDPGRVRAVMTGVAGVAGIHHLHVWQIDERRVAVEAHVELRPAAEPTAVVRAVKAALAAELGIGHSVLEPEPDGAGCADAVRA
jgi:cobalt-zinc-cadmium efflux system protein